MVKTKQDEYSRFNQNQEVCVMPDKKNSIKSFNQYQKTHKLPFCVYADFEASIEQCNEQKENASTITVQKQTPNSLCMYEVCTDENRKTTPIIFEGTECATKFIDYLVNIHAPQVHTNL